MSRICYCPHACIETAHLENALQVGVVGGKAMMGGGTPAEQQSHGVPLIPEGGLHPDEHVAKLLAIDQQVLPLGVQLPCTPKQSRSTMQRASDCITPLELKVGCESGVPGLLAMQQQGCGSESRCKPDEPAYYCCNYEGQN